MLIRKARSSSILRRRADTLHPHRRPKMSIVKKLRFSVGDIGEILYLFGAYIERYCKNGWRVYRQGFKWAFEELFRTVFGYMGRAIVQAWDDVSMPFKKIRRSFKSLSSILKSSKNKGVKFTLGRIRSFFKYGWLWNKHLVTRFMNYLLPVTALVVCVMVIGSMSNLNYAIEVNYNGETVGYVENEVVYDSARKIIQNRLIGGNDTNLWREDMKLRIAVVDSSKLDSQDIMAENLLNASGSVKSATGLYVGGEFYGATSAPELLREKIDALLEPWSAAAKQLGEDYRAKFVRKVELVSGIYPVESVISLDELVYTATSLEEYNIYYRAIAGDEVSEIAFNNGISVEKLRELNPDVELMAVVEHDVKLLVAENQMLLRPKLYMTETSVEAIQYKTEIITNPEFSRGDSIIKVMGKDGERTIVREYEFDLEGKKISETVIMSIETRSPVNMVIITGPKGGGTGIGSGGMLHWPIGSPWRYERGYSDGHRGIDLSAPEGTPVYAADSGIVTVAGILYDYGNCVKIDHQNGMQTLYAHNSVMLVNVGDYVSRGDTIAFVGSTGRSTGSHLHFEVYMNNTKIDPAPFIYD